MKAADDGLPLLAFADAEAFARWLAAHLDARGAWLQFAKKAGGAATLSKSEAIDCALCQGWIDGQLRPLDAGHFLTRFSPRKPDSRWSAANVKRAEALLAQQRVQARGLQEIEAAKADGRWQAAYPSASKSTTPPDFEAALQASPTAGAFFASLDSANRYSVLYRLHHAKSEVRERRIAEMTAMLERGETFHPPRKPRQRGASDMPKRGPVGKVTPS